VTRTIAADRAISPIVWRSTVTVMASVPTTRLAIKGGLSAD
jgi:hypothetical protein